MNGQSLSWNEATRLSGNSLGRRALVVDGNAADRDSLKGLLDSAGFDVDVAASSDEADDYLSRFAVPDAVIVDPDLAGEDGLALVRKIADAGVGAIFVVSADEDEDLADRAYAAGATDFSYKPVVSRELLARLRKAVTDRCQPSSPEAPPPRLCLNREERTCTLAGKTYSLTRHERDFLACLVDSPRHFATYDRLIAAVWGSERAVETQYLRVLAAQVRRKLENGRGGPPLIQTVVGEGMKLNN